MRACYYKNAIGWIVLEDDTEWLHEQGDVAPSVTACLIADVWGKSIEQVTKDLRREYARVFPHKEAA